MLSKKVYHLSLKKLQTYVSDNCFISDEEEFTTMLNFYHDVGIIIKHCSTVILSAEWVIDLFKQLITIPPFDETVRSEIHSVRVFEPLHQLLSLLGWLPFYQNPFKQSIYILFLRNPRFPICGRKLKKAVSSAWNCFIMYFLSFFWRALQRMIFLT